MTNYEKIEAFFDGELTEAERESLLREIESDPALKQEFELQKDIIEGIKAYRKEQLIARLDKLDVATSGQVSLLKALGLAGLAGILLVGGYILLKPEVQEPANNSNTNTEQPRASEQVKDTYQEATADAQPVEATEQEAESKEVAAPTKASSTGKENQKKVSTPPAVAIPEFAEPDNEEPQVADEALEAPSPVASAAVRLKENTTVEVKFSKRYKFHYQVKDGGLILYGKFDQGPFEVIEVKTSKGIASYLYYHNNFYCLETDSEEIKPLVAVTNPELIKQLEKRR